MKNNLILKYLYIFILFLLVNLISCSGGGGSTSSEEIVEDEEIATYHSKILMELFTSTTCGPCYPQNSTFDKYLDSTSNVYASDLANEWIIIRYHVWWPSAGDPYYEWNPQPVIDRTNYYSVNSVPNMFTKGNDSGGTASGWRSSARAVLNQRSVFQLTIEGQRNGYNLNGNVSVSSSIDIRNLEYKLYVAVTHDNSQFNAPNGQTVFDQTFIDFLTGSSNANGDIIFYDALNIDRNQTYTKNFNWTLDNNWPNNSSVTWSEEDLNIIAFIQFDGAGAEKRVYQVEAMAFD